MEKFNTLRKVVNDSIERAIEIQNFDITEFVQNMEREFTRLGFRGNNLNGGGSRKYSSYSN